MARIRVSVNRMRKGMTIAEDIYTKTGAILVTQGSPVTKEVVNLLSRHFIDNVAVEYQAAKAEPEQANQAAAPIVDEKQYQEFKENFSIAENTLSDNLKDIVYNSKDINVPLLVNVMNGILEKSNNETNLCNMLMMMKENTETLYTHSINVSIFGQILAKWLNCSGEEIEAVAVSGLLHDIGVLKLPEDKRSAFTFRGEMEGSGYEKHVIYGYDTIKNQDIQDDIKKAVLTHHERMDGSGFPLKVAPTGINKISRILAIVDIYDTFTMKEEGVKPMSVFTALKKMEELNFKNRIDSQYVMTFISHIAETMVRHQVLLSDGRKGRIVMINKYSVLHPLIQIGPSFVDLSKEKDIFVQELLD